MAAENKKHVVTLTLWTVAATDIAKNKQNITSVHPVCCTFNSFKIFTHSVMAITLPSPKVSLVVSTLLYVITLSSLQIFAQKLGSTELLTIVGGFISSLLFFFSLVSVGNMEEIFFGKDTQTGWTEVIFCLFFAMSVAATVHRVSVTTCFLFSVAIIFYLNYVAKILYRANKPEKR